MPTRFHPRAAFLAVLVALSAACGDRSAVAFGDLNSIIIIAPDSVWAEVEQDVRQALEPTILGEREERTFDVTRVSPTDPEWLDLRKFRQVLVIGRPAADWVQPVVEEAGSEPAPGRLIEATDIWAQGQLVHALLLPADEQAAAVREALPELSDLYDRRLRARVRERMYASGVDTALADTLRAEAGFALLLPRVYEWTRVDGVYQFVNSQPKAGQDIIRSVVVAWREGTQEPSPEALLAWRREVGAAVYDPDQAIGEIFETLSIEGYAGPAVEVAGAWTSTGDWPMAGAFIDRMVVCPDQDRTYLLDTYLFAPGEDKYEYVLQLRNILDTFECAGGP